MYHHAALRFRRRSRFFVAFSCFRWCTCTSCSQRASPTRRTCGSVGGSRRPSVTQRPSCVRSTRGGRRRRRRTSRCRLRRRRVCWRRRAARSCYSPRRGRLRPPLHLDRRVRRRSQSPAVFARAPRVFVAAAVSLPPTARQLGCRHGDVAALLAANASCFELRGARTLPSRGSPLRRSSWTRRSSSRAASRRTRRAACVGAGAAAAVARGHRGCSGVCERRQVT